MSTKYGDLPIPEELDENIPEFTDFYNFYKPSPHPFYFDIAQESFGKISPTGVDYIKQEGSSTVIITVAACLSMLVLLVYK